LRWVVLITYCRSCWSKQGKGGYNVVIVMCSPMCMCN
jgi:hypothetical protein